MQPALLPSKWAVQHGGGPVARRKPISSRHRLNKIQSQLMAAVFFFHESVQLIPICCQAGARPEERGEPRTRVAVTHTHTQRAATPPLYRPLRPFGTKLVAISGSIPGECSPARVTIKLDEETRPALHCERRKHSSPPYHIETPGD